MVALIMANVEPAYAIRRYPRPARSDWLIQVADIFGQTPSRTGSSIQPAMADMLVEHNSRDNLSMLPKSAFGWTEIGDWRCAACAASNPECMMCY